MAIPGGRKQGATPAHPRRGSPSSAVRRGTPEIDLGTAWTAPDEPSRTWRLSFVTNTGVLYAVRNDDDAQVDFGTFGSLASLVAVLPDWRHRESLPGSLDWVRLRTEMNWGRGGNEV
jgi:hypothetical protein